MLNQYTVQFVRILLLSISSITCQMLQAQTVQVKDKLLVHIPFDGDNLEAIKIIRYSTDSIEFSPSKNNRIRSDARIYAQNDVLKIGDTSALVKVPKVSRFPITITFWLKINTSNDRDEYLKICRIKFGKYSFLLTEKRNVTDTTTLFSLELSEPKNVAEAQMRLSTEHWQFFTIQVDEQGQMKFAVSNTIISNEPYEIANPFVAYSAPNLNISDVFGSEPQPSPVDFTLRFFRKSLGRNVSVDDIRVYNKILSKEELFAIASNDPYKDAYTGRYQLAYTCKQIADQYYLNASDVNRGGMDPTLLDSANVYYQLAKENMLSWVNTSTPEGDSLYKRLSAFYFMTDKHIDSLMEDLHAPKNKIRNALVVKNYYDLLLFDINYRLQLLGSGYSFWGKDFTENPLFPVQEYQFFTDTYFKFDKTYQKIEALLKYQGELDEKQEMNELQSQLAAHRSEIERVRVDETQFKAGFYDQQLGNIDARLNGITERQKYLSRQVERKEQALKKLDAMIMSQLSSAISQATLGVPIDVTRDLKSQLTNAGLSYLSGNPELSASLLGSYKDIYDVAITAREYYRKGKDVFVTVKSIASGDITVDNVLKVGDAVAESGFVDEEWAREWRNMKGKYADIQEQYTKGKELLQKVEMTARTPNLKNIVDFVDWMSESEYVPSEYRKEYAQFKEFRSAAYTAVKNKRYDDLVGLGLGMINNPALKAEVDRIRDKVKDLKPAFILIEMVKNKDFEGIKNTIIDQFLNGSLDKYLNEKIKNEFLFKVIHQYLRKSEKDSTHLEALFEAIFHESPQALLECFPYEVREDLSKLLTAKTYQELLSKLKTFRFAAYRDNIKVLHDTLFIYNEPFLMDISRYLNLDRETTRALVKTFKAFAPLFEELKTATTPLELYKIFEGILIEQGNRQIGGEFFTKVNSILTADQQMQVHEQTTAFYLGNGVFKASVDSTVTNNHIDKIPNLIDENNRNEVIGENMGPLPTSDDNAMMRQMAARALDMAFPGVGTALNTVLNIADAVFQGNQIVDELRNIYTEKVTLNQEYVKLMDNYRDNQFNKQVALYETRIAKLSYDIMLEEQDAYSKLVNNIVDRKKDVRRKIGGHLPLMFFYAERLRYYYQRLNKASVFWYGEDNSLNRIIFNDQNNLRLAIDPDIRLFDWIVSPDVTSSREDLFRLFSHWSRIYTLTSDGLTSNRLKYGQNISEITYQVLDLENTDPKKWKDFQRWKIHSNSIFDYQVDLSSPLSSYNKFGFDSTYISIKTIQVIPIALNKNNERILNVISLSNIGLSVNESGIIEPLAEKTRSSGDEIIEVSENGHVIIPTTYTNNLRYRWDSPNHDYQPFNFEGYNLRSGWTVKIAPKTTARNIEKLYFVVFYQFTKNYKPTGKTSPTEFLYRLTLPYNRLSGTKETLNITLPENPTIATPDKQFTALLKKYPYLLGRVEASNLVAYSANNGQPLIIQQRSEAPHFSEAPIQVTSKKKCFIKRLFSKN